ERVRFTSPHPRDFTDDVIDAMAETPNVMPSLHMPLQSGSDRVLKAMRRSYRAQRYLGIIERVRAAMLHAAITTDVIVGFPGETVEVLVAEGEGRKDDATHRLSGRARDNRLVHIAACDAVPGDVATARVTYAAPHHLVADDVLAVRRRAPRERDAAGVPDAAG